MARNSRRSAGGRLTAIRGRIARTVGKLTGRSAQKGTSKSGHVRVPRRAAKGRGRAAKGRAKRAAR